MIPLRDDNPTRSVPIVTYLLIAANVILWLLQITGGIAQTRAGMAGSMAGWTMIPWEILNGVDVARANPRYDLNGPTLQPTWLTLFTSMFLHGGLLHLGGNMLYLFIFGNNIEDALGRVKFLVFYLLMGVLAAFAHIAFNLGSIVPTLGASGAIAGVLGAYLVLYPRARVDSLVGFIVFFRVAVPAWVLLSFWIGSQFFSQFLGSTMGRGGGVAYMAHIGGFLAGALLIRFFGPHRAVPAPVVEYREYPPPPRSGNWFNR